MEEGQIGLNFAFLSRGYLFMESTVFIKGFLVGFLICAPFGPIGVLAVRRTLTEGRLAGFFSLLGASTADGVYCALAGLGVHALPVILTHEKCVFHLLAGLILIGVGVRVFLTRPKNKPSPPHVKGLFEAFTSTFLLVLANPMPILIFTALFTALGIGGWGADSLLTSCLVSGVFTGSASWSPILATGIPLFRFELNRGRILNLNRLSGTVIAVFGVVFAGLGLLT
jgi:threonine/homoserine/homoserine lactone efflux protein